MPSAPLPDRVLSWLSALRPAPQTVNAHQRLRVVLGACLGLRLAGGLSHAVMPLAQAWALLQQHRVKALPVVDRVQRIVGIVTRADFMRAAEAERREGLAVRLQSLLKPSPATHSSKPEVVGQIMTRQVRVASADRPIAELVPLFSATGHHHLPIVGEQARLVGILTQSDLVKALSHGP